MRFRAETLAAVSSASSTAVIIRVYVLISLVFMDYCIMVLNVSSMLPTAVRAMAMG